VRTFALVVLIALAPSASLADDPKPLPEQEATDFGYSTPEEALAALRSKPGVTIREENSWVVVSDPDGRAIWSITTPSNAVHPSGVKRAFVERDGTLYILMSVKCGSSKEQCDEMVRAFQALNAQVQEQMRSQAKSSRP
jgi:hypothetical protein